jgi:hypothetical protein
MFSGLLAGCGEDEAPAPAPFAEAAPASAASSESGATTGDSHRTLASPCTDMQVRDCRVELGAQGAVRNCFVGLQLCRDGKWGPCQEPDEVEAQLSSD